MKTFYGGVLSALLLSCVLGCDMLSLGSSENEMPEEPAAPGTGDFLSMTGERYETYYLTVDPAIYDERVSASGSAFACYTVNNGSIYGGPSGEAVSNSFTIHNMPLRCFFVDGTYSLQCSGMSWHFGKGSVRIDTDTFDRISFQSTYYHSFNTTTDLATNSASLNGPYYEEKAYLKPFESTVMALPKTSDYFNTDHVSRYITLYFRVSAAQLASFGNSHTGGSRYDSFEGNLNSYYTDISLSTSEMFRPFIHVSRNFYRYKTIVIRFDPAREVKFAYPPLPPLIESYDLSAENVLTVTLKDYNEPFEGPLFSYLVKSGSSWELKTISIE